MVINLILIISSILISLIGIFFLYFNKENLGTTLNIILNGIIYVFLGILFFIFFFLSMDNYFTPNIALTLWHISFIFWLISLSILSTIHKFTINFEKQPVFSTFFYALIIGLIIGLSFTPYSFNIRSNFGLYIITIENSLLLFLLLCYNLITIGRMLYNTIKYFTRIRNKTSKKMLIILTSEFNLIIIIYSLYFLFQNVIINYIYASFYLIGAFIVSYYLIRKPFLFIELTNKIYDFIIFHRSGILLYSYNFETGEVTDESLLKGSILIGINHILSNFINRKDQLGLIKMQNRDIILEYNNQYGYALLLTTNHKNAFINKAVNNFMQKFTALNKQKLQSLNGLIDISEFRNAEDIILKYFEPFLLKD